MVVSIYTLYLIITGTPLLFASLAALSSLYRLFTLLRVISPLSLQVALTVAAAATAAVAAVAGAIVTNVDGSVGRRHMVVLGAGGCLWSSSWMGLQSLVMFVTVSVIY